MPGEVPVVRGGPRHAAPRRPLLARWNLPAGKVIAVAAMPTAVLMGLGLTPTLAQARPAVPGDPFPDGFPPERAEDATTGEDGEEERFAEQSWQWEAAWLLLRGLAYHGVVTVTTPDGRVKRALKFTVDGGMEIGDLHQRVTGPDGRTHHLRAARGSTSTLGGGRVTLYTERLEGRLLGALPVVFDPDRPPPPGLTLTYFTRVRLVQAGQFGGDLTVPGLHQWVGPARGPAP
ncbi:hypothetical protein [Streptomyces sp. NPDC049906]|uniref:hypothetical protein n=1 Tax=Streptomyces sp. NPDC049906 TaxID=3155656 RepID=UPI0034407783